MRADYTSVFRNLRTQRRLSAHEYMRPYQTPAWVAWLGGAAMGFVLALVLFIGV